jgi:hypothetical protein
MKILAFSFLLFIVGCTVYNSCRPLGVGFTWNENEMVRFNMVEGNYQKSCVYTTVTEDGQYQYDCEWRKQ